MRSNRGVGAIMAVFLSGATLGTSTLEAQPSSTGGKPLVPGSAIRLPYPPEGVALGQGWNSLSMRAAEGRCVDVEEQSLELQSLAITANEVRDRYSYARSTDASVSVSAGAFGASASGSASSATSVELMVDRTNFLFTVEAHFGSIFAVPPQVPRTRDKVLELLSGEPVSKLAENTQQRYLENVLTLPRVFEVGALQLDQASMALLRGGDIDGFARRCGDAFVIAIHRGSRTRVLATFNTTSKTEKEDFQAEVAASGFGAKASGSMRQRNTTVRTSAAARVSIYQQGGRPIPRPTKLEELINLGSNPDAFVTNPVAFDISVVRYEDLTNFPQSVQLRNPEGLRRVMGYYLALSSLIPTLDQAIAESIQGVSDAFDLPILKAYGGRTELLKLKDQIDLDLLLMERFLRACFDHTTPECEEAASGQLVRGSLLASPPSPEPRKSAVKQMYSALAKVDPAGQAFEPLRRNYEISALADPMKNYLDASVLATEGLSPEFFLKYYNYLARVPLPTSIVHWHLMRPAAVAQGDINQRIEFVRGHLRVMTFIERLSPQRRVFCEGGLDVPLCIAEGELWDYANQLNYAITPDMLR